MPIQANGKPDRSERMHSGGNNPRKKFASKKINFLIFYDLFKFKTRDTRVWQVNPCKKNSGNSFLAGNVFIARVRSLIYIANKMGDKMQPCFTPMSTGNQSVRLPFTRTQHFTFSYKAMRQLSILPCRPRSNSFSHSIVRLI